MKNSITHQNFAPLPGVTSTQKKRPSYLTPIYDPTETPRYTKATTAAEYAPRHANTAREYVPQAAAPITEFVPRPSTKKVPAYLPA